MPLLRLLLMMIVLADVGRADPLAVASAERVARGMAVLVPDTRLMQAARQQADHMARFGRLGHEGPGGTTVFDRVRSTGFAACFVAENVAAGQRSDSAVIRSWMQSPGHRANILDPRVDHGAIAVTRGRDGRLYWAMVLAGRC
ncbi:CAP domain-containing protein [Jannaschia sp. 2305UL9-9]|uniref:CAP domain-containing protein n=1 Tax=Jannaschia sp. 2305UL9-9 TaxID=3121638 RepID=UPI00352913E6